MELEYHADLARWMGYGLSKLDFKINVHLSGKQGIDGFNSAWEQMSPELRNCLTLENDEYQIGLDTLVMLKDKVGIVLDVHHHLISTHEYIMAHDDRIKHVIDSWQGQRPVIHYSQSREDYLVGHDVDKMVDIDVLLANGFKKAKLRSHSDFMWNRAVNEWARQHWEWADVMVESKGKNLASGELVNQWQESI
jgi:UV DNA damage repair endonuclease